LAALSTAPEPIGKPRAFHEWGADFQLPDNGLQALFSEGFFDHLDSATNVR
jgi:hypothetical protein